MRTEPASVRTGTDDKRLWCKRSRTHTLAVRVGTVTLLHHSALSLSIFIIIHNIREFWEFWVRLWRSLFVLTVGCMRYDWWCIHDGLWTCKCHHKQIYYTHLIRKSCINLIRQNPLSCCERFRNIRQLGAGRYNRTITSQYFSTIHNRYQEIKVC